MDKKVVISIQVHEQSLIVADHLRNIKKFVPNSAVILHALYDYVYAETYAFHNISQYIYDDCKND